MNNKFMEFCEKFAQSINDEAVKFANAADTTAEMVAGWHETRTYFEFAQAAEAISSK